MKTLQSKILELCQTQYQEIVEIRRDLHMYPETEFDVQRTAGVAARELEKLGIKIRQGVGKTGVQGDLEVPGATRRIALRADMDALPMQELGNPPYKSKIDGKAHMCGHDAHTAMLIGAARVIHQLRKDLKVHVRFVFQPNEESYPGGARSMVEDGVLDGVDEIYGLHVWPPLSTGHFATREGPLLAQTDTFEITITGRGGHAAFPQLAMDPIVMGSQFVTLLQSVVSRNVDPLDSAVISVTQFHAGTTHNVIPPSVQIAGTIRTFKKETQQMIRKRIESLLKGITHAEGGDYTMIYQEGYAVTLNHPECSKKAFRIAGELVGAKKVQYPCPPVMGGEDFGCYSQKIPACFIFLGTGNAEKGIVNMCHDPRFDIDESCMIQGMAMHAALAFDS